ncbi:MAG: DHH family phosphoesterase [Thermodesulfobacteriota bacterium]
MKKHWSLKKENPKLREKLAKTLRVSPITAQLLINRGIENEAEASQFLSSTLFDLPSPYLMKGMDRAVERIKKALEDREKIAIYGDYDVDGVTSTALFYTFMKGLGADVTYYNPDRMKEGYGVNADAVRKLAADGVTLIISGDCGITAVKEVEEARSLGVDFIVTDHHKPPEELPNAVSILNPQLSDCKYPGKGITGVGVVLQSRDRSQARSQGRRILRKGGAQSRRVSGPRRARHGGRLRAANGRKPHFRQRRNKEDGESEAHRRSGA